MKRLTWSVVLLTAAVSGCQSMGDYAFFRDPDEQRAINASYTRDVMARQAGGSTAVGGTSGSGGGAIGGTGR